MTTTFSKLAAPLRENVIRSLPVSLPGEDCEIENLANEHQFTEGGVRNWPFAQPLLRFLSELMSLPRFVEIQALRVWLDPRENDAAQDNLLMVNFSSKLGAGLEIPQDDTIAAWMRQHQRPLIITAEEDAGVPNFARRLKERGINYFSAVPLSVAHHRIGVLGLASTEHHALGNSDIEFIQCRMANLGHATRIADTSHDAPENCDDSREEHIPISADLSPDDSFEGIIGRCAAMRTVRKQIKIVAPADSTVLLLGETGTGKELLAQAIHNRSLRCGRHFVKVNCAAIPAGLIESELFGHERGAFTGALNRRVGRFERADGGTLFLDEIGDIPLELQPKLLRVLQEQEFEPVGSTQTKRVNVRIVAATSRDLPQMVADREFRADLFYRLNVFPLRVPALRERIEDIPSLVSHFVKTYSRKTGKQVTDVAAEMLKTLMSHKWPGNVRELQNIIERAVILSTDNLLRPFLDDMQPSSQTEVPAAGDANGQSTLQDMEREHIIRALAATNWVIGGPKGAAARLGLQRTTLIAKMHRLGVTRAQA